MDAELSVNLVGQKFIKSSCTKMFHNFYVFNRKGKCLFYKEWDRPVNKMADDPEEERKLVLVALNQRQIT